MKKVFALFAAFSLLLILAVVVTAPSASAAAKYCRSFSKTYYLSDGSVHLRVATIREHFEVCAEDYHIVSTHATTSSDETGTGRVAGFQVTFDTPYRSHFSPRSVGYWAEGSLRSCAAYFIGFFCSDTERYKVGASANVRLGPYYVGAYKIGKGYYDIAWSHHCTNKYCKIHFNSTI